MLWVVPAVQSGVSVWNAIQGKKAGAKADEETRRKEALRAESVALAKQSYDAWMNGDERLWRISQIARAKSAGLTDAGIAEKEALLKGQNEALRRLRRMPNAPASTFLATDLENAKGLGRIALTDKGTKMQMLEQNYNAVNQGDARARGVLANSLNAQAGDAGASASQYGQQAGTAWGNVSAGLMGLAQSFAKMPGAPPSPGGAPSKSIVKPSPGDENDYNLGGGEQYQENGLGATSASGGERDENGYFKPFTTGFASTVYLAPKQYTSTGVMKINKGN